MCQEKYKHMAQYWFFSNLVEAKGENKSHPDTIYETINVVNSLPIC